MMHINRKRFIEWFKSLQLNDNKYHYFVFTLSEKLRLDNFERYNKMYCGGHEYHNAIKKYPTSNNCTWSYDALHDITKKPVYVYRIPCNY